MEIVICNDYDEVSKLAAAEVAAVVREKPDAVLGLATGSSPVGLYAELIRLHKEEGLDFSQVTTFNLDEYIGLPPEHEQSYRYFMNEKLFDHINIDKENTHLPDGMAEDVDAFCYEYESMIDASGGIDIQILGIGSDGHIGFNEPGSSLASRTRIKTLTEQTINDNARFFEKKEDVPIYAITMGVGTILDVERIVLVAIGKNKAATVAEAFEGPVSCMSTASALQLHPDSIIFLDKDAAGQLKMRDHYDWVRRNKANAPK